MSNIRIKSVCLENFKGFEKLEVDLGAFQAIVLAGKNGFGKTTIFDAIELVFTGKIKRYESYLTYHRQNTALSQVKLPLVYDTQIPFVYVSVTLDVEGKEYCLYRKEKHVTNPINFENVFNELKIKYKKGEEFIEEEYDGQAGLDDFLNSYSFLNYVSQEEATSFLKSKETERSEHINELFNTSQIDSQISKIAKIEKHLKEANKNFSSKIEELTNELSAMEKGSEENGCEYFRLVTEKEFDWDREKTQLSYEKFNGLLCENGMLDQLKYFCLHREDYVKWTDNKKIDYLLNSPLFPNLPYYILLSLVRNKYTLYDSFKTKLLPAIHAVAMDNLQDTITPILQSEFSYMVDDDLQAKIKSMFEQIQPLGRSSSLLGKALADLQDERGKMKVVFDKTYAALNLTQCPLCGQEYGQNIILKEKIDSYEHVLSESYPELQMGLSKMLKELRDVFASLTDSLQEKFDEWLLTEAEYDKFKEIDFDAYVSYLKEIQKFGCLDALVINSENPAEDILPNLRQRLIRKKQELDTSLAIYVFGQGIYIIC